MDSDVSLLDLGGVLIVSIPPEVHDQLMLVLRERVLQRVARGAPRGIVLDLGGVGQLDAFSAGALADLASMCGVLGCPAVVVGMRAAVANSLVRIGMTLPDLRAARTLASAIDQIDGIWAEGSA